METLSRKLKTMPHLWLVTGAAGFIGSNIIETLLQLNQKVIGLDNFSNGFKENIEDIKNSINPILWQNFSFIEADIRNLDACKKACQGVDFVLHQAALGSVPRSIDNPIATHESNITGHLNMLIASRDAHAKRMVWASSSSVYGDNPDLPKIEPHVGQPLSPYAITKKVNELYADTFSRHYNFRTIGLRYFNVFGPRQNRFGAYAAVIPKWITSMILGEEVVIFGDGQTSRDFCFVKNAVLMNLLAATTENIEATNQIYNTAYYAKTSLNDLFEKIRSRLEPACPHLKNFRPTYKDFRPGDISHSMADISKANKLLSYRATHSIDEGLDETIPWYLKRLKNA